ncbi:MAG: ABC transporter ATP-binding protein [Burkholderiaceae bacterium]|nr:ABC transporter ATP-binding protein [Burkholderiaceae bacterium]
MTAAETPAAALLDVRDLVASYGATRVLHGLRFEMARGSVTALLGANGAGKTTTLRALCSMVRTRGEIRLCGERIDGKATEDVARLGVAHVPDGRGTFLGLSTEENLRLGAWARRDRRAVAADLDRIYGYFPRLRERRRQQAGTLSGGEQQMLAVSRALMSRPRLLLLDEPSFGLAPRVVGEIFEIMRRINETDGVSILLVEQNASMALGLADHAYLLETGRIVLAGRADELRRDDTVRRAYFGH